MLKSLTFTNFQSHKKTTLTLRSSDRLVAIVGPSDSGKSSSMRGIRYLFLLMRPFLRCGENDLSVEAVFDDMFARRSSTFNAAGDKKKDIIECPGYKGKDALKKLHRSLPEEFTEMTRIEFLPVEDLGDKFSINFIRQGEQWLPEAYKASQISKILGSISGRNRIDSAIRKTNTEKKRRVTVIKEIENWHDENAEKLEELRAGLPPEPPGIEDVEELLREIDRLEQWDAAAQIHEMHIDVYAAKVIFLDKILEPLEKDLEKIEADLGDLRKIIDIDRDIPVVVDEDLSFIDDAVSGVDAVETDLANFLDLTKEHRAMKDEEGEIDHYERIIEEVDCKQALAVDKLNQLLRKTGRCPYSGEKLPEGCIKSLAS